MKDEGFYLNTLARVFLYVPIRFNELKNQDKMSSYGKASLFEQTGTLGLVISRFDSTIRDLN